MIKKVTLGRAGVQLNNICDYFKLGLWVMFFAQVIVLGIFNLTQLQYHMGYDASSYFLKAIEMAKQGTVFVDEWVEQTTLYFDSSVPLAALFYAITGNIFVSYGIANFLIDIAIFGCFYSILKSLKLSSLTKGICLNLIACIYITPLFNNANDVSYFSSVLSSGNWYGLKTLIVLMTIKMIFDIEEHKENYIFIIVTEILLFISGVSSGWYLLMTVVAPLLVFYVIKTLAKNSYKELFNRKTLLLMISMVLIAVGKLVATHILEFESKDSNMVLVGLKDFWKNLGSIILGFMELVGSFAHESNVSALTLEGIIYLFGFLIFLICLIGTIVMTRGVLKAFERFERYAVLLTIVGFNLLMFTVLYTTYGQEIFETRYLIPLFILLVACVGGFIDGLNDGLILKYVGVFVVFASLLILNVYYDCLYYTTKNNYATLNAVGNKMEELDVPVVYVYGSDLGIDCRNLRVVDDGRVYKYIYDDLFNATVHWGDYTYYDDVALVQGRNALVTTEEEFATLPDYIRNQYALSTQIDGYCIYSASVNKLDFKSGINADENIDFPTSYGIYSTGGNIDEYGSFVTDGTEGFVMWGPYTSASAGVYDFIIHYEIVKSGDETADFCISYNSGNDIAAQIRLDAEETTAVLQNVQFDTDVTGLEYRVYNYLDTIIRIDSIEINKKSGEN
jgi:hypothetical protein